MPLSIRLAMPLKYLPIHPIQSSCKPQRAVKSTVLGHGLSRKLEELGVRGKIWEEAAEVKLMLQQVVDGAPWLY